MINIADSCFYEKINFVKLKTIIDKRAEYENIIDKEKDAEGCDKKASIWAVMKKMYKQVEKVPFSQYGYIKVKYQKGKNCNDNGRWYAENGIGLAPIKSCVRHTICDDIWVDIDQVNSHPTILKQIMDKFKCSSPILVKYVENRDEVLKSIMAEEGFTKDNAKDAVISTINGKVYKSKTLLMLHDELKLPVDYIMKSTEYNDFYIYCKNTFGDKCNLWGKTMSRILQYEENKMLESYITYCYDKGLIEKHKEGYKVALVFDGFQLMKSDAINDELLEELRAYALDKTGFDVRLKIKPFDNALKIPEEYFNINEDVKNDEEEADNDYIDSSIKSYEDAKIDFEKKHCKIMYPPCVYSIYSFNFNDELQNFKNARDTFSHIKCWVIEKKKKVEKQLINIWLLDSNIRVYNKIVWRPPPLVCDDDDYNKWSGFKIANTPLINDGRDYWSDFLNFCYNLFESKECAEYILARYAFRIQNAGLRSKVCVIYYGPEGIGKSTFIETIYNVLGKYGAFIDKAKKIYESHSTFEKEKLFICVNEASGTDNFENSEVLKTRITEDKLYINPKGIQPYEIDNICDYDMTTNNINVVKITDDSERRWFQTEITNYYADDVEFFNDYNDNILKNEVAIRQIYEGLKNYKWRDVIKSGNFQSKNDKPVTEITKIVKECNRDKLIYFFKDIYDDYSDEDTSTITFSNRELFNRWINWCEKYKIKMELNNIQFGIRIRQIRNKVRCKAGEDFITKDSHSSNIIYLPTFKKFIDILEQ